jgi:hypothetical protein
MQNLRQNTIPPQKEELLAKQSAIQYIAAIHAVPKTSGTGSCFPNKVLEKLPGTSSLAWK